MLLNNKGNPVIALYNISLEREGVRILDNIDWRVFPGEHWAIIGQNSAGKTLLLKIISTYLWPSEGRVEILGEEFGKIELHKLRQNIGWVSSALEQDLPMDQPVLDIVLSGYFSTLRLFSKPPKRIIQRAKKILHLLGLNDHERQSFVTLSVGEKKKVLIARAILKKPRILILDEVCAGLDPLARKQYLNSLRNLILKEKDISVLFVTHHLEEIFPEITHVLGLNEGRVIFAGRKGDVLTSENIIALFDEKIKIRKENQNYSLDVF
ncbi:MAG: ATP-binding cassette domain-containing protein [Candidatus Bathyarchaeota archaeon]|nr:ATP-binding cassette domain-containing protein [Candidatus Bathyarchaeota archaeon]